MFDTTILRKVEATAASQQKCVFETVKLVSTRRSARSTFKVVLGIVEMQHIDSLTCLVTRQLAREILQIFLSCLSTPTGTCILA